MNKQLKTPSPYLDAFYSDQHLLFLFILDTFLESAELLKNIQLLCGKDTPVKTESVPYDTQEKIREHLATLIGPSSMPLNVFLWRSSEGLLIKLRNFCSLFQEKVEGSEKEGLTIQHYVEKICADCMHALEALPQEDRTTFLRSIEKADHALQRLAKAIARQIPLFKENENVVFFLINHWEKFDRYYGNRFTAKLANKMYPKGLREMLLFLNARYKDRGFEPLLSEIAAKVADLEATLA